MGQGTGRLKKGNQQQIIKKCSIENKPHLVLWLLNQLIPKDISKIILSLLSTPHHIYRWDKFFAENLTISKDAKSVIHSQGLWYWVYATKPLKNLPQTFKLRLDRVNGFNCCHVTVGIMSPQERAEVKTSTCFPAITLGFRLWEKRYWPINTGDIVDVTVTQDLIQISINDEDFGSLCLPHKEKIEHYFPAISLASRNIVTWVF